MLFIATYSDIDSKYMQGVREKLTTYHPFFLLLAQHVQYVSVVCSSRPVFFISANTVIVYSLNQYSQSPLVHDITNRQESSSVLDILIALLRSIYCSISLVIFLWHSSLRSSTCRQSSFPMLLSLLSLVAHTSRSSCLVCHTMTCVPPLTDFWLSSLSWSHMKRMDPNSDSSPSSSLLRHRLPA